MCLVSDNGRGKALLILCGVSIWIVALSSMKSTASTGAVHDGMDILSPYLTHHGPRLRRNSDVQNCQSVSYGNVTHSLHPALKQPLAVLPLVEAHYKIKEVGRYWDKKFLNAHHFIINNPTTTLSILEPGHPGSCENVSGSRATVTESSRQKNCLASFNAGLFDIHTGACLGNIVSEGFLIQDSGGIQNAHFGITKKGDIFTGYLTELDLIIQGFEQLVGGVIWLVRDGKNYVEESKKLECPDTEATGSIDRFVNVVSARTAIGHDAEGRVHVLQVNGKTDAYGIDLNTMADFLIELNVTNAINLDGGGSSTAVVNGTLVSIPSDQCPDKFYNCERAVSTIVCIHEPSCPEDCNDHGTCSFGVCRCHRPWIGEACLTVDPAQNCSTHGTVQGDACLCDRGWTGENCTDSCPQGSYGHNCSHVCRCAEAQQCDAITGTCRCGPGFIGDYCEKRCPYGYSGQGCTDVCFCRDSCFCDPVTGSCNVTSEDNDYVRAGQCLARQQIVQQQLVPDRHGQYSLCLTSLGCLIIIATASLILNVVFSVIMLRLRRERKSRACGDDHDDESNHNDDGRGEKIPMRRMRKRRLKKKKKKGPAWRPLSLKNHSSSSISSDVENQLPNGSARRAGLKDDELTVTGSGEDEDDLFLAKKKSVDS